MIHRRFVIDLGHTPQDGPAYTKFSGLVAAVAALPAGSPVGHALAAATVINFAQRYDSHPLRIQAARHYSRTIRWMQHAVEDLPNNSPQDIRNAIALAAVYERRSLSL